MLHTHLFRDLALFVEIAERKSFTRAAVALGMPVSSLSRRLRILEKTLGRRLIERTTRRLELTHDGEILLPQVARLLADAERTICCMKAEKSHRSVLTIALPNEPWAIETVSRALSGTPHGDDLRVRCSVQLQSDPIAETDIALILSPADRTEGDRHALQRIRTALVAAPDYLARHGTPDHPNALARQRVVLSDHRETAVWTFARGHERLSQAVRGSITADSDSIAIRFVLAGLGIGLIDLIAVEEDLQAGRLVQVLPDWETPSRQVAIMLGGPRRTASHRLSVTQIASSLANALVHARYAHDESNAEIGRITVVARRGGVQARR